MQTAQAGDRVENLASYTWRRCFRKQFSRLLHVGSASTVSVPVQETVVGVALPHISLELVGHRDHAPRQVRRRGAPRGGHGPAVFETPRRFGVPAVQLEVAPHAIVVHEGRVRQGPITAPQDDLSPAVGAPVQRGEDDAIHGLGDGFVEPGGWDTRVWMCPAPGGSGRSVAGRFPSSTGLPYGRRGPRPASGPALG